MVFYIFLCCVYSSRMMMNRNGRKLCISVILLI